MEEFCEFCFVRKPVPWTDYVSGCIVTFWMTMWILAGMLERFAPNTYAYARRLANERREAARDMGG